MLTNSDVVDVINRPYPTRTLSYARNVYRTTEGKFNTFNSFTRVKQRRSYLHPSNSEGPIDCTARYHLSLDSSGRFPVTTLPNWDGYDRRALVQLHREVRNIDFNAAVAWREREETLKLLAERLSQIVRALRALRSKDWRALEDALNMKRTRRRWRRDKKLASKDAAGAFLEYQFGWLPILSDIQALADLNLNHLPHFTCRSRVRSSSEVKSGKDPDFYFNKVTFFETYNYEIRYSCRVRLTDFVFFTMSQLGLTNVAGTLYATQPLSFVFNWFVDLQSWLDQFSTFHGLEVSDWQRTVRGEVTSVVDIVAQSSSTLPPYWRIGAGHIAEGVDFIQRYDKSEVSLTIPLPTLQNTLTTGKAFSMLALARQLWPRS